MYGKNSNLKAKKAKQNTHKKKKSQKKQLTDVKKKPAQLTCGAVRRGELESAEAVRDTTLAAACSWIGLEGGRDLAGLCPPSESLP